MGIGCQETTAEAANNRQTTGSASGSSRRIHHHSSWIKHRQGSRRFDQNQFHYWDPDFWASDVLPARLAAPPPLLSPLLHLPTAACGHPEKATKPRGWCGRGLEEPRVESQTSSFYVFIRSGTLWHYGFVIINKAFQNWKK